MTKEDVTMIGFEIVAYAGDARSKLMIALNKAQNGEFEEAENLVKEAEECLVGAHNSQTDILGKEFYYDSWTGSFNDNNIIERINETFDRII